MSSRHVLTPHRKLVGYGSDDLSPLTGFLARVRSAFNDRQDQPGRFRPIKQPHFSVLPRGLVTHVLASTGRDLSPAAITAISHDVYDRMPQTKTDAEFAPALGAMVVGEDAGRASLILRLRSEKLSNERAVAVALFDHLTKGALTALNEAEGETVPPLSDEVHIPLGSFNGASTVDERDLVRSAVSRMCDGGVVFGFDHVQYGPANDLLPKL